MRFFYCCVSVRPNNGSQVWHVYVVAGCRSTGHIVESELLWVAFYGSRRQFIIRFISSHHFTHLIMVGWWLCRSNAIAFVGDWHTILTPHSHTRHTCMHSVLVHFVCSSRSIWLGFCTVNTMVCVQRRPIQECMCVHIVI